ncbi:MAG: response regulator transcription factor [Flavipsychrobacter sp.]|nr:response regulator transcription factor [Flavipsychrobacter sp.]
MQSPHHTRLAIIDDHPIVIDGIKALLNGNKDISIDIATTSSADLLKQLETIPVDVLMTDIMMPEMNGNELAKIVKQRYPGIKILALSMSGQADLVSEMIEHADIAGYALKNISQAELVAAIQKIAAGGIYFSEEVLQELAKFKPVETQSAQSLTAREIEIIKLIEKDMGNKEIAAHLFISERTVETHRKNIFRKAGVNSVVGLIKYAYDHKLV